VYVAQPEARRLHADGTTFRWPNWHRVEELDVDGLPRCARPRDARRGGGTVIVAEHRAGGVIVTLRRAQVVLQVTASGRAPSRNAVAGAPWARRRPHACRVRSTP